MDQQNGVGSAVAGVATGRQRLLLLDGEALAAVGADQQPGGAPPGRGPAGIVRQHRLAVQRGLHPQRAAQDAGADQQNSDRQAQ